MGDVVGACGGSVTMDPHPDECPLSKSSFHSNWGTRAGVGKLSNCEIFFVNIHARIEPGNAFRLFLKIAK